MLNGKWRHVALAGAAALLALTAACGGDSSKEEAARKTAVCNDTKKAFEDFSRKIAAVTPTDAAAWNAQAKDLAGKLDGLGDKADGDLKSLLKDMAKAWRQVDVASADATHQPQGLIAQHPLRFQQACAAAMSSAPKG